MPEDSVHTEMNSIWTVPVLKKGTVASVTKADFPLDELTRLLLS